MVFALGYDMELDFRFDDGLGKTFTAIVAAWSSILICGTMFLFQNRKLPFLAIRNIPLNLSAVAILHVYWALAVLAYGLNGYFPCDTEFWIMNIYLPLGIALFHLANTKLLQVSMLQRKYASLDSLVEERESLLGSDSRWKGRVSKLKQVSAYRKTKWLIAVALLVQLGCSLTIFMMSRKFHSEFGLFGTVNPDTPSAKRACRRGWEWILSIVWQFFWSWIYAPYLLWKMRGIRDTHGWRTQTFICCLVGLPASPMWLLALYLPQMSIVDKYFIPPMWFVPSVFLIEALMIFAPCWQILRHRRLKKETLEIIARWEKQKEGSSIDEGSTGIPPSPQRISHKSSVLSAIDSRKAHPHMYTMAALDKALQTNSTPLLMFAALKDFSGENISFLNHVQEWNRTWILSILPGSRFRNEEDLRHYQFVKAVEIYCSFVSLRHSAFPINISHNHLKELESTFEKWASAANAESSDCGNTATPFDNVTIRSDDVESAPSKEILSKTMTSTDVTSNSTSKGWKSSSKQSTIIGVYKPKNLSELMPKTLSVPPGFGPGIFDNAAESVKYMVLTNTWPKFVDAGYAANIDKGTTMDKIQDRLSGCGLGRPRICSL